MHPSLLQCYGVRRLGITPSTMTEAGAALP